jgi:molybdopterin converting factor small subunit
LAGLSKSFGIEIRRDSTLVLVNGVEANALLDLDTIVVRGDEVSLIPMFHGGSER